MREFSHVRYVLPKYVIGIAQFCYCHFNFLFTYPKLQKFQGKYEEYANANNIDGF